MQEYRHLILRQGTRELVALTGAEEFNTADVYAYAVVSSSGVKLRQELTLDDARSWMERWAEEERENATGSPVGIGDVEIGNVAAPPQSPTLRLGRKRR